jgi:molecular chaperone DnaJ
MARRDYYTVLGVPRTATSDEVKKAFRQLAREHHPDVNNDPQADERFKDINEAYQVLGDPERRSYYDRTGRAPGAGGQSAGRPFGGTPFEDIFDMFFGGQFGQERARGGETGPERGSDLRMALEVTLEDTAHGADTTIRLEREETCPACFGTGAEKGSAPEQCPSCKGAGQVRYSRQTPFGSFAQISTCPQCRGTGRIVRRPCRQCRGSGRASLEREIRVTVPAGVEDGTRLRLQGEGEAGMRGGERGDLYVDLHIAPHPVFQREGRDLHSDVGLSMVQAALGDEIEVPTLDGPAPLLIPPGTQPDSTLAVRGKGLPGLRGGQGDLIVHLRVTIPEDLTLEQARLLMQFGKLRGEQVKPAKKTLIGKLREHLT